MLHILNLFLTISAISKFANREQNTMVVEKTHTSMYKILTDGGEVYHIAVLKKLAMNVSSDCVVLANKRFNTHKPKLPGEIEFKAYTGETYAMLSSKRN